MPKSLVLILLCYVFNQQLKSAFTRHSIYFVIVKLFFIVKFKQNLIKPYLNSHINIYWKNKKSFQGKSTRTEKNNCYNCIIILYTVKKKNYDIRKSSLKAFLCKIKKKSTENGNIAASAV